MRRYALLAHVAASAALALSAGNDAIYAASAGPPGDPPKAKSSHKQNARKIKAKGGPKRKAKKRPPRLGW